MVTPPLEKPLFRGFGAGNIRTPRLIRDYLSGLGVSELGLPWRSCIDWRARGAGLVVPGTLGRGWWGVAGSAPGHRQLRRSDGVQPVGVRTKTGLARAVSQGKNLGRPKGSKDKCKRGRQGYLLRYAKQSG